MSYLLSEFKQAAIFVQNMEGGHYYEGQGLCYRLTVLKMQL